MFDIVSTTNRDSLSAFMSLFKSGGFATVLSSHLLQSEEFSGSSQTTYCHSSISLAYLSHLPQIQRFSIHFIPNRHGIADDFQSRVASRYNGTGSITAIPIGLAVPTLGRIWHGI